ncbi:hypothetical protein Agub_g2717, partial [Astrephomene gubernaculifera]
VDEDGGDNERSASADASRSSGGATATICHVTSVWEPLWSAAGGATSSASDRNGPPNTTFNTAAPAATAADGAIDPSPLQLRVQDPGRGYTAAASAATVALANLTQRSKDALLAALAGGGAGLLAAQDALHAAATELLNMQLTPN